MDTIEEFKKQHLNTYKNAVIEIINNNTNALVHGDILSLIKTPPLDSMDIIRTKLLALAKKEKVILNTEQLTEVIDSYRVELITSFEKLSDLREHYLSDKIKSFSPERDTEIIKIPKKDLEVINKKIKKEVKQDLDNSINNNLLININKIYREDEEEEKINNINKAFKKFMKTTYQKQLNENISIKIMVKDRTLISGIAEQGERYLFTKSNSHLFDESIKSVTK